MRKFSLGTALVLLWSPLIWGAGFAATKLTLAGSGPLWANAVRFLLSSLVLLPFAWPHLRTFSQSDLRSGALLGLFLFLAFSFQTAGLAHTSLAHSSFITGLYAAFVPLFGPWFGQRPARGQVAAVGMALAGLLLLTWSGGGGATALGDGLTLGCSLVSAVHILLADRLSTRIDPVALNWLQLVTVAALSAPAALALEGAPHIAWTREVAFGQAYLALFSSGVAFTLQFWAQRRISPTAAAMIFLLEAPFGALAGVLCFHERLGLVQVAGAGLMLAASYLAVVFSPRESPPEEIPLRETGL